MRSGIATCGVRGVTTFERKIAKSHLVPLPLPAVTQQGAKRTAGRLLSQQGLPNQEVVQSMRSQSTDVVMAPDARFTDDAWEVGLEIVEHAQYVVGVRFHRPEVPIVDTQQVAVPGVGHDHGQPIVAVEFDQRNETEFIGKGDQVGQEFSIEQFNDQEYGIGTSRPGLPDLVGIDKKVLAEDRQADMLPDPGEILEGTAEEGLIRQA